jgi:hypothetical protein
MYEYKFVRIDLSTWKKEPTDDYHKIVEQHALDGWRLFQIFAPNVSGYGVANFFELIFERQRS